MSGLSCCIWWFVAGVLVGWLLNWLLSRLFSTESTSPEPAPQALKAVDSGDHLLGNVNTIAAAAAGIVVKGEDDLTVIEGIGPKIAEVLRSNGIRTLTELSHKTAPEISALLEAAGPRYKLANPSTWPMQADLAANNRWVELKQLQDELIGGVFPSDEPKA